MTLANKYSPAKTEPAVQQAWQDLGIYQFEPGSDRPVYSIDTPPPTVSGHLHLGHVYSYSHPDFMARFWRMNGYNVYYPMGFDDNGLPTERLVESAWAVRAAEVGRQAFIEKCLQVSERGRSSDYRSPVAAPGAVDRLALIPTAPSPHSARRISQFSFIEPVPPGPGLPPRRPPSGAPNADRHRPGRTGRSGTRRASLSPWPLSCDDGQPLAIATTRPELLPACVAVFVHPDDARYADLAGRRCVCRSSGSRCRSWQTRPPTRKRAPAR